MPANVAVSVRLPEPDLNKLDDYRREQPNLPSRPEAIRALMRAGLGEVMRPNDNRGEGDHQRERGAT
jgi:hypothetical protein